MTPVETVTEEQAAHYVLHRFGPAGNWLPPGDFVATLLDAAARADADNLNRLRSGFPILIGVFALWRTSGPDPLIEIATADLPEG